MIKLLIGFFLGSILTGILFLWRLPKVLKVIKKAAKWANEKSKGSDNWFAKKIRELSRKINEQAKQVEKPTNQTKNN